MLRGCSNSNKSRRQRKPASPRRRGRRPPRWRPRARSKKRSYPVVRGSPYLSACLLRKRKVGSSENSIQWVNMLDVCFCFERSIDNSNRTPSTLERTTLAGGWYKNERVCLRLARSDSTNIRCSECHPLPLLSLSVFNRRFRSVLDPYHTHHGVLSGKQGGNTLHECSVRPRCLRITSLPGECWTRPCTPSAQGTRARVPLLSDSRSTRRHIVAPRRSEGNALCVGSPRISVPGGVLMRFCRVAVAHALYRPQFECCH